MLHHVSPERHAAPAPSGRRRQAGAVVIGLLTGLLSACSSVEVRSDFDPDFDFSSAATFEWIQDPNPEPSASSAVSPLDLQRFESAVQSLIIAAGYEPRPPGDLLLRAALTSESEYRTFVHNYGAVGWGGYGPGFGGGFGPGYWGGPHFGFGPMVTVSPRTHAVFFLDVLIPEAERLVWRGSVEVPVRWFDDPDPTERQARIDELARRLMERFPRR